MHLFILYFILLYFTMDKQVPKGYLFLHNISKKNNIGNIIRSACAFGFITVFYVSNRPQGSKKMKAMKQFHCFGNQGTLKQIQFHAFTSFAEAKKYFIENNIKVCGVQIGQNSKPVHEHPFTGSTAFFLGNEGSGILPVHRQFCDQFVYIPQYTDKTASLNVSVAAGIVFHHFAVWGKFKQSKVFGQKYQFQIQPKGQPKNKQKEQSQEDDGQIEKEQKTLQQLEQLPFSLQQDNDMQIKKQNNSE